MKKKESALWKVIEKFSFFYPLSQVPKLNTKIKKMIWMAFILLAIFFILLIIYKSESWNMPLILLYVKEWFRACVPVQLFLRLTLLCYSHEELTFNACVYSKWVKLQFDHFYSKYKDVKIYQYLENWDEYIKFIFTETSGWITTETFLYNPKMDKFLEMFQGSFRSNGINCEKISNLKGVDVKDRIDYKAHFGFLTMWKLLPRKEILEKLKLHWYRTLFVWVISLMTVTWEYFTPRGGLIMFWICFTLIMIWFIREVSSFYVTIENNAVWVSDFRYYLLSNIEADYKIEAKWNLELISLTIKEWEKTRTYKRPRHKEVERFCNDLLAEIQKRKSENLK